MASSIGNRVKNGWLHTSLVVYRSGHMPLKRVGEPQDNPILIKMAEIATVEPFEKDEIVAVRVRLVSGVVIIIDAPFEPLANRLAGK